MAGLYVHVPFCRFTHAYDDAYAVETDSTAVSEYEEALCRELRRYAEEYASEEQITTVYAGGSRPSLLPLRTVHSVLATVLDTFDASAFEEATAELNPADVEPEYVRGLRRLGFDRASLQVLSFLPGDLEAVDAPHSAEESVTALRTLRAAGIDDVSVDLLFGWPNHSFSNWRTVLHQVVEMGVPHVTLIEAAGDSQSVDDDEARADRLEYAMTFLQSEGYEQYELTHFARPGFRSTHQENYYAHGNQLGLGPSAESFWWTNRSENKLGRRWVNVSDLERYAELLGEGHPPTAFTQTLTRTALAREYILLRLRTATGLDLNHLANQYGFDLRSTRGALLERLRTEGLIHDDASHVKLTNKGRLLADGISERLIPS